jgi:hypothetical protein
MLSALVAQRAWSEADANEKPIREFDIPTLEKLAQQMNAQDRLAWRATDVLVAHRTEAGVKADGVNGWITSQRDGRDVVRFIHVGDRGPEVLYDVAFPEGGEPTFAPPSDRTLSPDEIAQYAARTFAKNNIATRCSDRYNTVALKDPESDGWLVWALAASLDPNVMPIGGHYRFTISPDGRTIRARDALSRSCMNIAIDETNSFMSHLVSLTPLETHAFASLTYHKRFHVGTEDGRAWRVDGGRIVRVEQDAPGDDGAAARAIAAFDEKCTLFTSKIGDKSQSSQHSGDLKVIEATEHAPTFSAKAPPGQRVGMVACIRKEIVPSPNDYKVCVAGYPLTIADHGTGHVDRIGMLFLENGKFRFEIVDGPPLSEELAKRVDARLAGLERAIQARH